MGFPQNDQGSNNDFDNLNPHRSTVQSDKLVFAAAIPIRSSGLSTDAGLDFVQVFALGARANWCRYMTQFNISSMEYSLYIHTFLYTHIRTCRYLYMCMYINTHTCIHYAYISYMLGAKANW